MKTMRTVAIIIAAIIVAVLAIKVLTFVTGLFFNLIGLAILAAAIYVVFLIARSAIGRRSHA